MLVGILSMQRIVNYGSFMQAYSLKKMVESLGHKVVFVDYKTNVLIEDRNDKTKKQELLYQEIKDGIKFHILKKYGEQQKKFIECYPILGISKFKAYHTKVDVLIVGSDEVFNCTQRNPKVGFALDFFGENNKARRLITYAASFGSTTYEKLCSYKVDAQIKKDLKMFDAISVRDNNSYSIVEKLCGVKSNLNLDPVLVSGIENEPWKEANIENYIIVYGYAGRFAEEEKQAIVEFAHKNKLKTISLCDYQDFCDQHIVCRPDEILGYFKKANYIVTDTFHGTIDVYKRQDKYKTQKYYEEEINGVKVLRIRVPEFSKTNKKSRVKNIVSYFFGAMGATFKVGKMDYVFSISQPPILGGLLGVWGKWMKHAKYIYNIQDFNPEQVLAVGYTKSKLITDAMMWFDKFSCKRSDLVITVGRDLVETVENRFKDKKVPKTVMINNWIDENEIYPLDESNEKVLAFKKKYGLGGKFVIMYSGNIGLYYDLENLIKVVEKIKPGTKTADGREVVFAFVGAGSVLDKLVLYVKQHHMDNVTFIPYQDKADLIYSLNAGDVHWCVNAKGIKGVSCPSKAYGIMAASKPILGVLESGSEVRCLIEDTHGGLCCEPGEYDKVEENIRLSLIHILLY